MDFKKHWNMGFPQWRKIWETQCTWTTR